MKMFFPFVFLFVLRYWVPVMFSATVMSLGIHKYKSVLLLTLSCSLYQLYLMSITWTHLQLASNSKLALQAMGKSPSTVIARGYDLQHSSKNLFSIRIPN